MKDSKKYSPKVTKLFNSLKRKSTKHKMPQYNDPIEAVVFALVSEHVGQAASERMYKRMMKHFVNLNDLRVSRREEMLDVFGNSLEASEQSTASISQTLQTIFEKYDKVSLAMLAQEGKRQAHKELSEIEGITLFAVSYCFLTALDGHAIPLNSKMLDYLRAGRLVHSAATDAEIAGFLERQIGAADAYSFYRLLRDEAERAKPADKAKKAAVAKKITPKKKAASKKKSAVKKKTTTKKTAVAKKKTAKKKTAVVKKKATKKKTVKK